MKLEERELGLLALVEAHRDRECKRLLDEARAEAKALLAQTYARQREALHQSVLSERSRAQGLIQAAQAERATLERRRGEVLDRVLTDAAWPLLLDALRARWGGAESRASWVDMALQQAQRSLPSGAWRIEHAHGWTEAERTEAATRLQDHCRCSFHQKETLQAGLIIRAGDAVLDAGLDGLLRDRAMVEARMLALWSISNDRGEVTQ